MPEAPSDAELIARVRHGDVEAYGELFSRHHHAAERLARQLVPAADADDLAGDAFAKVLDALRGGGGPDVSFRAYLLTTVRRVHVDRIRAARKVQSTDDIESYEREPEEFDDPTVLGFESGAAAKAFASLPERWQAVLWHTEVEGEKPATIAPLLGLTPNGVSALAYRAREGLRQAYLQQHLADVAGDRCRWATERLGAYVRDGLTKRENKHMREHIDECTKCTAVYLELVEVNSALPALLAPALLGTAGAGYLAATGVKVGGGIFFLITKLKSQVKQNGGRTAGVAGAVVVVAAIAALALMAMNGDEKPPAAPAAIPPVENPTQPTKPPVPPTQPPKTQPPPTTKPTEPSVEPTTPPPPTSPTTPTPPPTSPPPTSPPPTTPTPPPTLPPRPVLDEGFLIIRPRGTAPASQPGPYAAGDAAYKRLITIEPPRGNTSPVVVKIAYGRSLSWPVAGNPGGWSCNRGAGTCTAKQPHNPAPLPIDFDAPSSGFVRDRTYTVSAKTARLYDDDSETLPGERMVETLVKLAVRNPDPDYDAYNRTVWVKPMMGNSQPVSVRLAYGDALSWPIDDDPWGWNCRRSTGTCTASSTRHPAPLHLEFDVPEGGSVRDRTYTVTARVGLSFDTDSETLDPLVQDESLLRVVTPDWWNDPNPFVYNRLLKAPWSAHRVTFKISYSSGLVWRRTYQLGWHCERNTSARTGTCTTPNYTLAGRLNTEWDLRSGQNSGTITIRSIVGGRYDVDTTRIPD